VDLHQIVMNLVLNARDAVGPDGRIEVAWPRPA
jgi:signal transduction histidine kinase